MKLLGLLVALALLALPSGGAAALQPPIQDPPECIREGPPCGPGPIDPCLLVDPCPASGCLVGDRSCLIGVETYDCVTAPCGSPDVCVYYGRVCDPTLP